MKDQAMAGAAIQPVEHGTTQLYIISLAEKNRHMQLLLNRFGYKLDMMTGDVPPPSDDAKGIETDPGGILPQFSNEIEKLDQQLNTMDRFCEQLERLL